MWRSRPRPLARENSAIADLNIYLSVPLPFGSGTGKFYAAAGSTGEGDTPAVTQLKLDPYQMTASYGQFTRLTYTLDRAAVVSVTLTSPSGTSFTILDQAAQPEGVNEVQWTAVDPGDPTGKTLVVTEEGMYMVTVRATNPDTGTTATAIGNLQIFQ